MLYLLSTSVICMKMFTRIVFYERKERGSGRGSGRGRNMVDILQLGTFSSARMHHVYAVQCVHGTGHLLLSKLVTSKSVLLEMNLSCAYDRAFTLHFHSSGVSCLTMNQQPSTYRQRRHLLLSGTLVP